MRHRKLHPVTIDHRREIDIRVLTKAGGPKADISQPILL
jgi:hypothetical protein